MQQLLLPMKRAKLLSDKASIKEVAKMLACSIKIENGNTVEISGDAYAEYLARNVITAFGRGFEMETAMKLLSEEIFFSITNLKDALGGSRDRVLRIKARIIGKDGRTKRYIEEVSGADVCIYGNTVSFIGTNAAIEIANAAVDVLVGGGTHKKAYRNMEATRRKFNKGSIREVI